MHTLEHERTDDETPTRKEAPSGKWLVAIDRGARLIADTIASLEAGGDIDAALEDLRAAHALVNGAGQ